MYKKKTLQEKRKEKSLKNMDSISSTRKFYHQMEFEPRLHQNLIGVLA